MSELINKLNEYRSMGDRFYPEDIVVTEDIWTLIDEIEKLNNDIKELLKENSNKEKIIIAQDNIIKEIREYIEENLCYSNCDGMKYIIPSGKDVLEILNKGE